VWRWSALASFPQPALEPTCYSVLALGLRGTDVRERAQSFLLHAQNPNGSWPAFAGDDHDGSWVTSLESDSIRACHQREFWICRANMSVWNDAEIILVKKAHTKPYKEAENQDGEWRAPATQAHLASTRRTRQAFGMTQRREQRWVKWRGAWFQSRNKAARVWLRFAAHVGYLDPIFIAGRDGCRKRPGRS